MVYPYSDFTEPNVCIDENLTTDDVGALRLQRWSVPRSVADVRVVSTGDGPLTKPETALPGKLMLDKKVTWLNDTPLPQPVVIRVTKASRSILTSNPNAIQVRDRWTYAIDTDPAEPVTSSIFNGQFGGADDFGTNTVAEPVPGRLWLWSDTSMSEEWVPRLLEPNQKLTVWYRCYVWTPPPWANNANKNSPAHEVYVNWVRLQLLAFPHQGTVVTG